MSFAVKRVYEKRTPADGTRVLVDRVWPRGLTKEKARVDVWLKDIAPSPELRKWFRHDPERWDEFRRRYFRELDERKELVKELRRLARREKVTLLFGSREERFNNAVALREYLTKRK